MASPPPSQPTNDASTSAASPSTLLASQPLQRVYLASTSPGSTAAAATPGPPLFTGRPLNPTPPPGNAAPSPHGILYSVASSSGSVQNHRVPPMAMGHPHALPVAVPMAQPQQPLVHLQPRSYAAVPRALVAGVAVRPEQPPRPRGVPIAQQPKMNPAAPTAMEQSNQKDKKRSSEDSSVWIHGRKVNLQESESGSLYALCRSWVRNGVPHESPPSFDNGEPILPRPLPAAVIDISEGEEDSAEDGGSDEEPQKNADGEYNTSDLLKQHVKRAKKIRARLQQDRFIRIERYKQRLALLLPPPI